jgi:hypothetical protein
MKKKLLLLKLNRPGIPAGVKLAFARAIAEEKARLKKIDPTAKYQVQLDLEPLKIAVNFIKV